MKTFEIDKRWRAFPKQKMSKWTILKRNIENFLARKNGKILEKLISKNVQLKSAISDNVNNIEEGNLINLKALVFCLTNKIAAQQNVNFYQLIPLKVNLKFKGVIK